MCSSSSLTLLLQASCDVRTFLGKCWEVAHILQRSSKNVLLAPKGTAFRLKGALKVRLDGPPTRGRSTDERAVHRRHPKPAMHVQDIPLNQFRKFNNAPHPSSWTVLGIVGVALDQLHGTMLGYQLLHVNEVVWERLETCDAAAAIHLVLMFLNLALNGLNIEDVDLSHEFWAPPATTCLMTAPKIPITLNGVQTWEKTKNYWGVDSTIKFTKSDVNFTQSDVDSDVDLTQSDVGFPSPAAADNPAANFRAHDVTQEQCVPHFVKDGLIYILGAFEIDFDSPRARAELVPPGLQSPDLFMVSNKWPAAGSGASLAQQDASAQADTSQADTSASNFLVSDCTRRLLPYWWSMV